MKKKILAVILALALAASCIGCGQSGEEAQAACQQFFDAYIAGEGAQTGTDLSDGFASGEFSPLQSALAQRTTVELKSAKASKDSATVKAVITAIDVAAVFQALPHDIDSTESAKAALLEAFAAENAPMREFEVEVQMTKADEQWLVCMDAALSDALLGGFNTMLDEMTQEVPQ